MSLFDDSPELRNPWSLASSVKYEARLRQLKAEFTNPDPQLLSPPKPTPQKRQRTRRQIESTRRGRYRYRVG